MNPIYENKSRPITFLSQKKLFSTPHLHKELEIISVESGNALAHADKSVCKLESGDIFVAFPNQIHYYEHPSEGLYYVMIVNPDIFFAIKNEICQSIPQNNKIPAKDGAELRDIIERAASSGGEYRMTKLAGYMNLLGGALLPKLDLVPSSLSHTSSLHEILDFCSRNFTGPLTLSDISEELHLSRYHISHLLSEKLNLSFNSYINSLRINMACDLLRDTDKKIADISEDVGFGTIRSFNRAFEKALGTTPVKYRQSSGRS